MARSIVVCCDGTADEFSKDRTIVAKLYYALVKDTPCEVCCHRSVGTMAPAGFTTKAGGRTVARTRRGSTSQRDQAKRRAVGAVLLTRLWTPVARGQAAARRESRP